MEKELRNNEILLRLRDILDERGMTQRDLARLLGKKEAEVSRWFSGKFNISRQSQIKIETALGEPLSADSTFHAADDEIRIGIIGVGDMGGRFVREAVSVEDARIAAAFDTDTVKCEIFCRNTAIDICCRTVEELLANVDAVYVSTHWDSHYHYVRMALECGRHVLCEMPFVSVRQEAEELIRLAAKKNLVLLPAIKTAYCPSFQQMMRVAKSGMIGDIADVSATVTNLLPEDATAEFANERMMENLSYPLLTFFKLLGTGYRHVSPFVRYSGDKMLYTNTSMLFDSAIGNLRVGVGVKSEGNLVVSGTRGYIYVPAPWWKPDYFEVRFENPAENKKYFFPYEAAGLRYEIQVLKDKINRQDRLTYVSREEMLKMIEVQNKIK